ncbi:MAG: PIG-L family deacetylase [Chloroflexi bacterium]|nr:MAG: PIG-L family deacetylase [Chloroflexota bacterium]
MNEPYYDLIYLSPHLDDAALSCGGQIWTHTTNGRSVLIVTIMAGDPPNIPLSDFARLLHDRWSLAQNAVTRRREEDACACRVLGAEFVHWDIPDCIYRYDEATNEPLYPSWADIITTQHPADNELIQSLVHRLLHLPAWGEMVVPLGVGGHVDHRITRLAAEKAFGGENLLYYEDYPYVREPGALEQVILGKSNLWQPQAISLSAMALSHKVAAIACYASQLSSFFNGRSDLEQQIAEYAQRTGGERVWRQAAVSTPGHY